MHRFLEVFITHKDVFGREVHPSRIEERLSAYPLASVLRLFSRILHVVELGGPRLEKERTILRYVGTSDTVQRVEKEIARLLARGASPRIFTELTLRNFLKLALRNCPVADREISNDDADFLFQCYLATHDHFPRRATRPTGAEKPSMIGWNRI